VLISPDHQPSKVDQMTPISTINKTMSPLEWGLLLLLSLLWGGSFFFVGIVVHELPTLTIVTCRVGLAAFVLAAIMKFRGLKMPRSGGIWAAFLMMGLLNNVIPFTLIVWGQNHIASGLASILNATTPLFTVVVAHYLTGDEKMTWARLVGVLLGLAGVAAMIGIDVLGGLGVGILAQLAIMAAALSYAFAGVFGRRFKKQDINPIATATGQVAASSLVLVPLALFYDQPWQLSMPGVGTWMALFGLAALSTALAYILYFSLLASAGATNLLLVTFLIPVTAILLGIFFLGESLAPKHMLGMLLIGLGLMAIDGRPYQVLKSMVRR